MTELDRAIFAVQGSLLIKEDPGLRIVNYWFHAPFFWRVELNGTLILQTGYDDHVKAPDQVSFDIRLLSKPKIFSHYLGLRSDEQPFPEDHSLTGRPGYRIKLPGNPDTSVLVDNETSFVMQFQGFYEGQAVEGDHNRFDVVEELDPALFGETSLDAQGYYHGSLG